MKAIVRERFGSPDVLQFAEAEKPAPKDNEVLIKVYGSAVNPVDLFMMKGWPWYIRLIPGQSKPKSRILGCDIAGRVEAVGKSVKQFQLGDEVFGVTGFEGGGFAEYTCALESKIALKAANCSFEEAAAVPVAATTALQGLRDKGGIKAGHKVLVYGSSGGVGTFAVQIAKFFGAEVTAVCSSRNVDQARSLGADHVVDYTQEDFRKSGRRYDLILAPNSYRSIFDFRGALAPKGTYVIAGGAMPHIMQALLLAPVLSRMGSRKTCFFIANINQKDLVFLKDVIETGKVTPVIDRRYPLRDTAEALRYLEKKHAQGKVVLTVDHDPGT
jgi:NADPH:quinone reductase-like Zn-dependent oxidoreductase